MENQANTTYNGQQLHRSGTGAFCNKWRDNGEYVLQSPIGYVIFIQVLCHGFDMGREWHLNFKQQLNVYKTA